ncbi:hypothetical protein HPP92_006931 [Vanilla planifolia]|uniref:Zinc finger protein CONSTANS-LIKE 13 n=1 Tax=Vanilla planifolia TaxID=51239 RepID=A0A835R9J1_VANPL|nr:hypothetical protein HPP92_006931 [Vanilla planifolia]
MVAASTEAAPCGFCGGATPVVYCRADSASLCLSCDHKVHAANTVSSRHHRSLLCDGCATAPAVFFCPSPPHGLALCSNCDFDAHREEGHRLDRRAVEPFSGCPTGAELAAVLGLQDEKGDVSGKVVEGWPWETPPVFSWDDLILPPTTTPFHGYQAMGVPPPAKDRNSYCGKRKEEILRQIRELSNNESDVVNYNEVVETAMELRKVPLENFQLEKLDPECGFNPIFITPNCEHQAAINTISASSESLPENLKQGPRNPEYHGIISALPHKDAFELLNRSSVLSRYKEKRKTRRYDKLVRYESRKARAESRLRIKGRFAKVSQIIDP